MTSRTSAEAAKTTARRFRRYRNGILQRKCACGGSPGLSGECKECNGRKLQRATRNSEPDTRNSDGVPPIVHEVLRSPSQPLDAGAHAFIEPRFGHDFSQMHVYANTKAAESTLSGTTPSSPLKPSVDKAAPKVSNLNQVSRTKPTSPASQSFIPVASGLLQRKCACGKHTPAGGDCAECSEKKLSLQRRAASCLPLRERWGEAQHVPPIVHEVLRSHGNPLDAATRAFMESRFGYDFSRVRVHADAQAAASARAMNAMAYTVARDVVFGAGQYAPATADGRRLLAHELTHVVQQGSVAQASGLTVSSPVSSTEQEAETVSNRLMNQQGGTQGKPPSLRKSTTRRHHG